MGDAFKEGVANEVPVHRVCLTKAFEVDVHEVTNAEYKACVGAKRCSAPGTPGSRTRTSYYGNPQYVGFPVVHVSWNQAREYCSWAGARADEGENHQLEPTKVHLRTRPARRLDGLPSHQI
jgi:formylglycine-generating enzyme required for sulfatase activity